MRPIRRRLTATVSALLALGFVAFPWAGGPTAQAALTRTVVTIQFDDGTADQYGALRILNAYGMHATFYVNSGVIGDAEHMTWTQLSGLFAAGNEIAGHTLYHTNIKKLKTPEARVAVCQDRNNLLAHGLQPTSFAYPFGSFDAGSKQVVADCGYNSGRGVSGVDDRKTFAETIPPLDAYATRTPPNPKQGTKITTIEGYVKAAEQNGGGWVQLVFHHVCNGCDAYSIPSFELKNLLAWLQPRTARGTVVQTTNQVIGGPVNPPVQP